MPAYGYEVLENNRFRPWHLSQFSQYEVQRTNNFVVVIDSAGVKSGNSRRGGETETDNILSSADLGEWLTLSVESCPLPDISNPTIELAYQNSKVKVAGQAEFGDIELVVKDAIEIDAEAKLWAWRRQVYNPETGQVGWAEDYKRNGHIYQYAPDGTCERGWRLIGMWPQNLGLGDMNYDGGDKKTISMTLAVDFAWMEDRDWNDRHDYDKTAYAQSEATLMTFAKQKAWGAGAGASIGSDANTGA